MVVDDLSTRADAVLAPDDREGISRRDRRHGVPRVWENRAAESHPAGTSCDANQRETRKSIRVGTLDAEIRVSHRRLGGVVLANEIVADAGLVDEAGVEGVNLLQ